MRTRTLAALCAAAAFSVSTAYAQPPNCIETYPCLPDGTPLTCQVQPNGTKVWVDAAGNTYGGNTQGNGTFEVSQCLPADCKTELKPISINITSQAGPLGTINTTLDASRGATPSTLVSLFSGQQLPAEENFYFYANATLSSKPGAQYRSIQELHFRSKDVQTFNPHINEKFELQGKVDFEDVNNPGVVVFTLQNTSITLDP